MKKFKAKVKKFLRNNRIWLYPSMFVVGCICLIAASAGWSFGFILAFFLIPPFVCSLADAT